MKDKFSQKFYSTFFDEEAEKYGLNEAIIIQKIRSWLSYAKANDTNFYDGKYWVYNSINAWEKIFPWWSKSTIIRCLDNLEKMGVIVSGNYNKSAYDRTKWYSLSDELFDHSNINNCANSNSHNPFDQNEQINSLEMSKSTRTLKSTLESPLHNMSEVTVSSQELPNRKPISPLPLRIMNILREEGFEKQTIDFLGENYEKIKELASCNRFTTGKSIQAILRALGAIYEEEGHKLPITVPELIVAASRWLPDTDTLKKVGLAGWIEGRTWENTNSKCYKPESERERMKRLDAEFKEFEKRL